MVAYLALVFAVAAASTLPAEGQVEEYQLKAAFLFNFAKFVEWPASTFKSPSAPIVICVLGENVFGQSLAETVRGKVAQGRAFVVNQLSDVQTASSCQILFVNPAERNRFRLLAANLKAAGVLTVGETPGFAADGGIINFQLEGGRIRLEINLTAVEQSNLRVSSKLLSMARIVRAP